MAVHHNRLVPSSPEPPAPIRGGTFFYCPWGERRKSDWGSISFLACGIVHAGWATGTRFRTCKAYRQHWRRYHSEVQHDDVR